MRCENVLSVSRLRNNRCYAKYVFSTYVLIALTDELVHYNLTTSIFKKHPVNGLIQKTICLPVTAIFCNKQFLRNVRVTSTCKSMDEALVRALFKKISSLCKITKARFFSVLALKVVHSLFKDCFQFVLADNGEKLPLRTDVKFFKFPKALL